MGKVQESSEDELEHPHEILRQNLKRASKIITKDGQIKKKPPKLFTLHKCDVCNKEFTEKGNLTNHMKLHSNNAYSCAQCAYVGKTVKYLSRHRRQVHGAGAAKRHKCAVCGKLFNFECNLKVHAMVHTGEKPFKCDVCGKTFRVTYSLNTHMLLHKNEKPFKCSFCAYACRDSSTLRKHESRHMGIVKAFPCKICSKTFPEKAKLRYHISDKHLSYLDLDMKRVPCAACGRSFRCQSTMVRHVQAVHERALAVRCPVCGKAVSNSNNLAAHLRTHFDLKPFLCAYPRCAKAFKDKGALKRHNIIHYPHKHHPCIVCGATFARRHRLAKHMHTHAPRDKCVTCDYCSVSFFTKNYLIKHIRSKHTGDGQTFICDHCGLTTHNKPSIVMHLKHAHLHEDDRQCKLCKKKYKDHKYLKQHYLRTHKIVYKTTRKAYVKRDMMLKPSVEVKVKVEPLDADTCHILDIKEEIIEDDPNPDNEYLPYSKQVLSEDLAETILRDGQPAPGDHFDTFLLERVFHKQDKQEDTPSSPAPGDSCVDQEQLTQVNQSIKNILKASKAKLLKDKQRNKVKLIARKMKREAKLARTRREIEAVELEKVIEMYNERMRKAIEEANKKEPLKKIKYFNKKLETNINSQIRNNTDTEASKDIINPSATSNDECNDGINNEVFGNSIEEPFDDFINHEIDGGKVHASNEISKNDDQIIDSNDKSNDRTVNNDRNDDHNGESTLNINNMEAYSNNYKNDQINDKLDDETPDKDEIDQINDKVDDETPDKDEIDQINDKVDDETPEKDGNDQINDEPGGDVEKDDDVTNDSNYEPYKEDNANRKMSFKTHQCYICFKLYPTKEELIRHCQSHFDICNETTLKKCPICNHVSTHHIKQHMLKQHGVEINIAFNKIKDRKTNSEGSRYCYDMGGSLMEIIPSVKVLNHAASMKIDKRKREMNDKIIAKTKLVRHGNEWIVQKEAIKYKFEELPEIGRKELSKLKITGNYIDRLGEIGRLARKKGLKILFPCNKCEKICQNFSALKLHSRRHDPNKKPFKPRVDKTKKAEKKREVNLENRLAKPQPIKNKHKCDKKLREFYEKNIRGGDVEFWQFLKIFNKMDRENIKDFKDFEGRPEFGIHTNEDRNIENVVVPKVTQNVAKTKQVTQNVANNRDLKKVSEARKLAQTVAKNKTYAQSVPVSGNITKQQYKRVIMISKKEYTKRQQEKMKLRETLAKQT